VYDEQLESPSISGHHTFPRSEHVLQRSEYLQIYDQGRKTVGRQFILYVVRDEGHERKFGIAVSRRVGNAVVRNRVKRYIREVYRLHRPELDTGIRMVLVARPRAAKLTFHECEGAILHMFQLGGALCD
jgi:ribonuclease P protein component